MAESEPQRYGNFVLLERIAVGGMAEIFRAKKLGAEGFEKELVVKRILPHFSEDEAFVTMFKDEARIAANLNHANIVQVYEFDECEGSFYIAMEYIEGKDLKRIIDAGLKRQKPLLPAECVYIIAQVADGLHYAHTRTYNNVPLNIVHRDVSPHNIMIAFEGDVKLMDFGIAKAAARSTKTQAGTVKGKCAYMSPEQARGKDLDGRSDLFSLGICLWEMVTGQRLFVGDTEFETLSKVLKAEIAPPREFNNEVHPKLEKIILQSLTRDREMRFKDLGVFKQQLMSFFYQHCDPDQIDLGAYMRWLYRKGPLPRSRDVNVPPPTVSAPVYRSGPPATGPGQASGEPVAAATPPGVQERKAGVSAAKVDAFAEERAGAGAPARQQAPVERTAVMPELLSSKPEQPTAGRSSPAIASVPTPPVAQPPIPAPDPTVPMEPYRPEKDGTGRVNQQPRAQRSTDRQDVLREALREQSRSREALPVAPSGPGPTPGRKTPPPQGASAPGKKGQGGGFPIAIVALVVG
ncbi:MAG: hypothetical protein FJ125_09545, partial [Deltaproteobacteria bacterium]|nr:hypothetical protein [Deltaproteobacteria bacterium]